ncbi:putative serine protease [Operophtera brumata]|uniref:Putative serine protease n=1 Tax=Operophtera brumata TaxID=104452 RepID=A0A0L7KSG4_OPEBR|nr:putative serine protease [Operophtera brumata]
MNSNSVFLLIFCVLFCIFVSEGVADNVKKSVDDNRDDNGETNDEAKDESLEVPSENEPNKVTCSRRINTRLHEIRAATRNQYPFMAAVMSDHDDYICSGSVVSNGLILTTAQCTQQSISYVLLNSTGAKKDEGGALAYHIIKTDRFPTFSTTDTDKDVGLLYTDKFSPAVASKIKISDYRSTRNLVDVEAIGFGLNSEVGTMKELQYIGVENRGFPIPMVDSRDLIRGYFDCIDTKVVTCFKDTGGPGVFNQELIGIVVKGQTECIKEMTSAYAVNKKLVEILPTYTFKAWLDEKITKNEEKEPVQLVTFPSMPTASASHRRVISYSNDTVTPPAASSGIDITSSFYNIFALIFLKVVIDY